MGLLLRRSSFRRFEGALRAPGGAWGCVPRPRLFAGGSRRRALYILDLIVRTDTVLVAVFFLFDFF